MKDETPHGVSFAVQVLGILIAGITAAAILLPPAEARSAGPEAIPAFAGTTESVKTLIPLGRTVGIKLFSDGVLVVGLSEIPGEQGAVTPAKACGLKEGDIITHINSSEVDTIEQVQSILKELEGDKMSIRAMRGTKQLQMTAQATKSTVDGEYKLGAWIRDSMAGIGTMTFYDPATGLFGALGHGISDIDTLQLMPLESGAIMHSSVIAVQKGQAGSPGELRGAFQVTNDLGQLLANTESGVFGTLEKKDCFTFGEALPVATRRQVTVGPAVILSNIEGETVTEYTVEITKVYAGAAGDTRDMMVKVTDPRLLEKTGGIVQGMSGSPILQDGRLIGAVTHVLINDPTSGYGILAERMLSRAEGDSLGAAS